MRPIRAIAAALALCAAASGCQSAGAVTSPHQGRATAKIDYQRGIDLDFYWHAGLKVAADVTADARYARALGASAVMISFPLYTSASVPSAGAATPPPSALAAAVRAARATGLQVGVRPLIDEANLPRSRPWFMPDDAATWLKAYAALLIPYARAAQQGGAVRFWIAAELTLFAHEASWALVTSAVRSVFSGQLYWAANWVTANDTQVLPGSGGAGVTVSADAYPLMPVQLSALRASWAHGARVLPPGTVLSEVGIAARAGAQDKPYQWKPSNAPLDPAVQEFWFNAACDAVTADRLGGLYFWSLKVGDSLTRRPTPPTANQFTAGAGATVIKSCFQRLRRASA